MFESPCAEAGETPALRLVGELEDGFGDEEAAEGEHGDEAHAAGEAGEEYGGVLAPFEAEAFFEVEAGEEGTEHLGEDAGVDAGTETANEAVDEHGGCVEEGQGAVGGH